MPRAHVHSPQHPIIPHRLFPTLYAELLGQEVELPRLRSRRPRFPRAHFSKRALDVASEILETFSLKHFHQKHGTRCRHRACQLKSQFGQINGPWLIDFPYAGDIGCHIGHYKRSLSSMEPAVDGLEHRSLPEIAPNELHAADGLHGQDIHRNHSPARTNRAGCNLRPTARGSTEVQNYASRPKKSISPIDLHKLVGGARPIPVPPGALDERVSPVRLYPARFAPISGHRRRNGRELDPGHPERQSSNSTVLDVENLVGELSARGTNRHLIARLFAD